MQSLKDMPNPGWKSVACLCILSREDDFPFAMLKEAARQAGASSMLASNLVKQELITRLGKNRYEISTDGFRLINIVEKFIELT